MTAERTALVVVQSQIISDPRVRRQIDWLSEAGWTVDTLGEGPHPADQVRTHFALTEQPRWATTRAGAALVYGLLPNPVRFRILTKSRIPADVASLVADGTYDLVIFNDRELVPWVRDRTAFTARARAAHLHLDLHEYFTEDRRSDDAWGRLTAGYQRWLRAAIADPVFTTRSTVASGLADMYRDEFGIARPAIIRNSPDYVDQAPTDVDPDRIELLYHGLADWTRGLRDILDAMPLLDERFRMNFMLTGHAHVIEEVRAAAASVDRVRFHPPVALHDIATTINAFDLEIIYYRPSTPNLRFSLPNKFFESVQGRIGVVIGESPMMAELARAYGFGVVVPGWGPQALAAALNALAGDQLDALKRASDVAARELNADAEKRAFLDLVNSPSVPERTGE